MPLSDISNGVAAKEVATTVKNTVNPDYDDDTEEGGSGGTNAAKTPVSLLQELFVRRGLTPKYELVQTEGAMHDTTFIYRVTIGEFVATGCGKSKKKAKHSAAKSILDILKGPSLPYNYNLTMQCNDINDILVLMSNVQVLKTLARLPWASLLSRTWPPRSCPRAMTVSRVTRWARCRSSACPASGLGLCMTSTTRRGSLMRRCSPFTASLRYGP